MAHFDYISSYCSSSLSMQTPIKRGEWATRCWCYCGESYGSNRIHEFTPGRIPSPYQDYKQAHLFECPDGSSLAWNDAENDPECQQECREYCRSYQHTGGSQMGSLPSFGSQPPRPQRGRGYNRGGRVNTNRSRFSGRTQNNPKGRPKK